MPKIPRSAMYPSYELETCFQFANEIYDAFGKVDFNSTADISESVGKAYSTLKQKFSSTAQYGLLELKKKHGFKVTELCYDIRVPKNDQHKKEVLVKAFSSVPLYKKLLEKYNGEHFPSTSGLKPLLIREYEITESAVNICMKVLFKNIEYLGLMKDGILLIDNIVNSNEAGKSNIHNTEEEAGTNNSKNKSDNPSPPDTIDEKKDTEKGTKPEMGTSEGFRELIPIFLDANRTAYLKIPNKFNEDDLEYLIESISLTVKRIIKKTT